MRPTAALTRGTSARASEAPWRRSPIAARTSDGPGTDGSLTGPTLRIRTMAHYSVAAEPDLPRVGGVTDATPVSWQVTAGVRGTTWAR
jgi:hypothetical protein